MAGPSEITNVTWLIRDKARRQSKITLVILVIIFMTLLFSIYGDIFHSYTPRGIRKDILPARRESFYQEMRTTSKVLHAANPISPWAKVLKFQLYLRMNSHSRFLREYKEYFLKSFKLFMPPERTLNTLVIGYDDENPRDHKAGAQLRSTWPYPKACYVKPAPNRAIYDHSEKKRMFWDHFRPDLCVTEEYVGYVDSDTMFTSLVTPNSLFRDGRPVVIAHIGPPNVDCWANNTEYMLGMKEAIQCMSYFPCIYKVSHIIEMREFVSKKHGKPFDQVFLESRSVGDYCMCQFSVMCNYVWYFHRDKYYFRLHMAPDGNWDGRDGWNPGMVPLDYLKNEKEVPKEMWIPIPRIALHDRYIYPSEKTLRSDDSFSPEVSSEISRIFKEGLCHSVGFDLCPERCKEFNRGAVFYYLYSFEWWAWTWDSRCLEEQQKYYQEVKSVIEYYLKGKVPVFGVKSKEEICKLIVKPSGSHSVPSALRPLEVGNIPLDGVKTWGD